MGAAGRDGTMDLAHRPAWPSNLTGGSGESPRVGATVGGVRLDPHAPSERITSRIGAPRGVGESRSGP